MRIFGIPRWIVVSVVILALPWLVLNLIVPPLVAPTPAGPAVAPDPAHHPQAIIQVYGADVYGIRGNVAIHTWIALKARNAPRVAASAAR